LGSAHVKAAGEMLVKLAPGKRHLEEKHEFENPLEMKRVFLQRLPEPVWKLNWQQTQLVLTNLLTAANHGNPPDYGNPNAKPPFWPGC